MKKKLLTVTMITAMSWSFAQNQRTATLGSTIQPTTQHERCSTPEPPAEWDAWFNQRVEDYKAKKETQKVLNPASYQAVTSYTIPVVVHVIHGGQPSGTYPNIKAEQINSQITVLNQDYSGSGYNATNYPAAAFKDFAANVSNGITAASKDANGRIAIANTGIVFCMAVKDPSGNTLTEPGIHRVDWHSITGATDPALATDRTTLRNLIETKIKPNTIWDPTKYMNIWITDEKSTSPNPGLLGYATFPAGSSLPGISGAGTNKTDGFWAWTKVFGSANVYPAGTYDATYKYGRTSTHEIGHWLGLRHIWGDGGKQCGGDDYCKDTPPQKGGNSSPPGANYGCPTYPFQSGSCSLGGQTNTNGDMFMNFMDYSDDLCMYMFTMDQTNRIQTTMAEGIHRKFLGTHGLCNSSPQAPIAKFGYSSPLCAAKPVKFTDLSQNLPTSWSWSVSPAAGVTLNTATSQHPAITFANPGTYTVNLTATNAQGNNTTSKTVTVADCSTTCDTLKNIVSYNDASWYFVDMAPYDSGYISGTNAYKDLAKAEMYTDPGLNKKIKAIKVNLAIKKGTANVTFNVWDDVASKPGNVIGTATISLSQLTLGMNTINLQSPVTPPAKFYVGFTIPSTAGDTIVCYTNDGSNLTGVIGSAWELQSDNKWYDYSSTYSSSKDWAVSNHIFPVLCPSVGVADGLELSWNINMLPNPSTGQVNFVTSFETNTDLNFMVCNTLGAVVYSKTERNVANNVIHMDLSMLNKGIYFVTIMNQNGEKVVKKLILE